MECAIDSLSAKISCKVLVPKTFLKVVAANNCVDLGASSTFVTLVIFKIKLMRIFSLIYYLGV